MALKAGSNIFSQLRNLTKDPHISKQGFGVDTGSKNYLQTLRDAQRSKAFKEQRADAATPRVTGEDVIVDKNTGKTVTSNFVDGSKARELTPDEIHAQLVSSHLKNPRSDVARSISDLTDGSLPAKSITHRWDAYLKKLRAKGEPLPTNEDLLNIYRDVSHPLHKRFYGPVKVKPKYSKPAQTFLGNQGLLKPGNQKKGYSKYQVMNDRFTKVKGMDANKFSKLVEDNTVDGLGVKLIDNPDPLLLKLGTNLYKQENTTFNQAMLKRGLNTNSGVRQKLNRSGLDTKDWESMSEELQDYIVKHQVGAKSPQHIRDEVNDIIAVKIARDLGV